MKWQEMNAATRRKAIVLAVIVATGITALLWPVGTATIRRRPNPFPLRKAPAPNPGRGGGRESFAGGAGASPGPQGAPPAVKAGAAPFLGKWETETAAATKRGVCMLQLEITRKPGEPGHFIGAATLKCVPVPGLNPSGRGVSGAVILAGITPLSAAMSGAWEKDSIAFQIDRLFNAGDCGWTGLTVSRFGSDKLTADYRDACGGGAIVMRRAG